MTDNSAEHPDPDRGKDESTSGTDDVDGDDVDAGNRGSTESDGRPLRGATVSDGRPLRGADMARQALAAARARNASANKGTRRRSGTGAVGAADGNDVLRLRRRRWSGPGADKARDPQLFGDVAQAWVARADTGGDIVKARLFAQWAAIVGADIAAHAQPVALVDKELSVQAESTAWATQLRLLAPGIVKKINEALGHGTVLRIRAKGPTAPSWRFGNRHVPGRGPRDTYG